jgi:hypothetical protein
MIAMPGRAYGNTFRRAATAIMAAFVIGLAGAGPVLAADDDDDDTFEQKIIKGILGGLGVNVGKPGIDYRERSPLVVPPSRDLPPPQDANALRTNPAWPRDPEQADRARRKAAARDRIPAIAENPNDPGDHGRMTPEQLRRGTITNATRSTDPATNSINDIDQGRNLRPTELGDNRTLFNFGNPFNSKPEVVQFEREPPRTSLTQPPPGYQTPSTAFPYGVAEPERGGWKIPNLLDRPVGNER